jgi:spore maturation protein CgeB
VADGDFVNPRTFEIAACGACQLVDRRSLMGELFDPDELATFGTAGELRELMGHYLAHPEERLALARRGRRRVLAEHSYRARMTELLALGLAALPETARRLAERLDGRERLQADYAADTGLQELLGRLPTGETSLEGVWEAIAAGSGDLSRAEKIFLMLRHVELKLD